MITEVGKICRAKDGTPELKVRALPAFVEGIAEAFLSSANNNEEQVIIAVDRMRKDIRTLPQLAYLYGHLARIAYGLMEDWGWSIRSREDAITELKYRLKFTKTIEIGSEDIVRVIPLSLSFQARTNRKRVNQFIDDVFFWLIEHGGQPMTSEQYLKEKTWK
jgi:hypothetical protein